MNRLTLKIGYFCSAGYTETGGIDHFLRKLRGDVQWMRRFPIADKPAPKLGRTFAEPRREHSGITGPKLVERMLECLRLYHGKNSNPAEQPIDLVVLIDDADCRFKDDPLAFQAWTDDLRDKVRRETERPELDIVVILASPEIESWLLSDWEESFGLEYMGFADRLREHLEKTLLGPAPWSTIEAYGGRYVGGSCERKLSEDLQGAMERLLREAPEEKILQESCYYSKKLHGARMLGRIRPEALCTACTLYFKPAFDRITALTAPAAQPEKPAPHKAKRTKRNDRSREGLTRPPRGPRRS